jgi:peptidoglycan hydrolase-like protein with peptidoglycan-binding domain
LIGIVRILLRVLALMIAGTVCADELTQTVQEQLKAQGAYSGPIDGKPSTELTKALKDYQQRHHLPATGVLDRATAKALDDENGLALPDASPTAAAEETTGSPAPVATAINTATPAPSQSPELPASPAPVAPSPTPTASPGAPASTASPNPELTASPSPPEEAPSQLAVERATKFLRDFLHAGEGKYVTPQLRFYSLPVDYFEHGTMNQSFVRNDILHYMRRWPRRNYKLSGPVTITPVNEETATAEFTVSYKVQRGKRSGSGSRSYRVTLREIKGELKIVAIKEQPAKD